ncbi:hypothetical protein [Sphingomonas xanthus]|uniref:Glycosyltransferase RgtA/B/C/D-like domain-containing protein n=1 Tax=Sphingomonas xanthus TaxID=2594473 RepID=A0A516IRA8_9SPHN|nr:hypothetical protein [Sphingomonas xanthus]QDP19456.1 hypothetical protein FMM02_05450 [Sphingomonas xanthus]
MMHPPHLLAQEPAAAAQPKGLPRPWWEGRPFVAAMILLALLPLLYPTVPPLVDIGGHMGRYKIALDLEHSATLQQWFTFRWLPIGNLGVDLLVVPLGRIIGLEPATKLIVMAIPAMTVAGMLWVAREVHNRLPPTAAFALPLAYGHPFLFGFVNFSLSMALALLAFGLWLRLGRLGKSKLRALLFVPISFVVFFAHTFGWGTLGLLCFSAEAVRQHDRGRRWWISILRAAWHALAMIGPAILILLWRSDATGGITDRWFDWGFKWEYLLRMFRDRWEVYDIASATIALAIPLFALVHPRLTLSRNLAFSGLVLAATYVLLPRIVFGSAYADMRLVPFAVAMFILAIRFKAETRFPLASWLAVAAVAFMLVRIGGNTISLWTAGARQERQLGALDHVPTGSRVAVLVWDQCEQWAHRRSDHLGAMATVRREAYTNDHWPMVGSSLLTVTYPRAGFYQSDPSQIVRDRGCLHEGWWTKTALIHLPRQAFDYLWLLDMAPIPREWVDGWQPVWASEGSILLKRSGGEERPPG